MILDKEQVQAVIFDMDGVLFLSSDCHERAWREVFLSIGITDFSYAAIAGMRTDEALVKILAEHTRQCDDDTRAQLIVQKRAIALKLLSKEGLVSHESPELISSLKKKYRLALASSASSKTVELFLQKCGYADVFEVIIDGSMVKHAKPAPDIYVLALEKLGLRSDWCVVVEDSASGVMAAKQAHIPVIALATEDSEREKLMSLQPEACVERLSQIQKIL